MATVEKLESGTVPCSVCLEHVRDAGDRSIAKLKCGHHFHLDCIGSAFNAKGSMQCPNCRHVEDGRWLYANGCRSHDDWPFEELPSPFEDDYELYGGFPDLLHFGHFQWCPYQANYPQYSFTLEEVDPPAGAYPDLIVNVLYGDHAPSASQQQFCPYLSTRHARRLDDHLVNDMPDGGSLGGNTGGAQSFTVSERSGWPFPSHSTAVGMMNDVGLSSIPNERFRWSVAANRSDASQPAGYNRQHRTSEATSWNFAGPCPQHGVGGSSHASAQQNAAPTSRYNSSSRRQRHRNSAASSSVATRGTHHRSDFVRQPTRGGVAPIWGTSGTLSATEGVQDVPFVGGGGIAAAGWQQLQHHQQRQHPHQHQHQHPHQHQQANSQRSYQRDNGQWTSYDVEWRPWFQTGSSAASASYHHHHADLGYGAATAAGTDLSRDASYAAGGAATGFASFDAQSPEVSAAQLRSFMPPPR